MIFRAFGIRLNGKGRFMYGFKTISYLGDCLLSKRPMYLYFRFLPFVLVCFLSFETHAQFEKTFEPLAFYNEEDEELIKALRQQLRDQLATLPSKTPLDNQVRDRYIKITNYLISRVKKKGIVKDELLQEFVESVFNDLVSNTPLKSNPRRVLVAAIPYGNAMCMGEGTFFVTTGLLARIDNESQLAFVLAHEIAHYELGHVRAKIVKDVKTMYEKKVNQGVKNILQNYRDPDEAEMDSLRRLVYAKNEFSRKQEREADSLGFIIHTNASYNARESAGALAVLDSIDYTKDRLGLALFDDFHFVKYPFDPEWLRGWPSQDSDEPKNVFIFSTDSIRSHPEIILRINALQAMQGYNAAPLNKHLDADIYAINVTSEFENVDLALRARHFSYALLMALELKQSYPQNSYLVSKIGKILLTRAFPDSELFPRGNASAAASTRGDESRMISTFLHNLKPEEAGELAFHFLNSQKNFNLEDAEHYFLLYMACQATDRENVADKIRDSFKERFEGTKSYKLYIDRMRKPSAGRAFVDYLFQATFQMPQGKKLPD